MRSKIKKIMVAVAIAAMFTGVVAPVAVGNQTAVAEAATHKFTKAEKKQERTLLKKAVGLYYDKDGWTFFIDKDEDGKYYFCFVKPGDTGHERNIYSCKGKTIVFREDDDYMGDPVDEPTWYKLVIGKKNIVLYRKF